MRSGRNAIFYVDNGSGILADWDMRSGRNGGASRRRRRPILADWDMCSGRNCTGSCFAHSGILADWDMRSGRNRRCRCISSRRILADWDMRSGRNCPGTICKDRWILTDWDMRSGRNQNFMVAGGAKNRVPSNYEILTSQGLQEGHLHRLARADLLICRSLDQQPKAGMSIIAYRDDRYPTLSRRSVAGNL